MDIKREVVKTLDKIVEAKGRKAVFLNYAGKSYTMSEEKEHFDDALKNPKQQNLLVGVYDLGVTFKELEEDMEFCWDRLRGQIENARYIMAAVSA